MSLVSTQAVILHAFKYGETSKIVRLLTPQYGVESAIAKGALRPKSRFGARLQVLSEGTAQLYRKATRDLQLLAEFDVTAQHEELAGDVRRYAAAMALAELILRFAPAEPQPQVFELMAAGLRHLGAVRADRLEVAALKLLWTAVRVLGFAPSVERCARDARGLPPGTVTFSIGEGGFLCAACARGTRGTTIKPGDRTVLEELIAGPGEPQGALPPKHAAAHRRLLARFVERHVAEGRELTAVGFWTRSS